MGPGANHPTSLALNPPPSSQTPRHLNPCQTQTLHQSRVQSQCPPNPALTRWPVMPQHPNSLFLYQSVRRGLSRSSSLHSKRSSHQQHKSAHNVCTCPLSSFPNGILLCPLVFLPFFSCSRAWARADGVTLDITSLPCTARTEAPSHIIAAIHNSVCAECTVRRVQAHG